MAKINSDHTIVTVEKNDTLSAIVRDYGQYIKTGSTNKEKIDYLCKLNSIPNPDVITIGQKIKLGGSEPAKNVSNMAVINVLGLISTKDDRSVYATWTWDKPDSETEHYQVQWSYYVDKKWHKASDEPTTVKSKYSSYNAPSYATSVKLWVKPISKKKKDKNGKETTSTYWTASKSTEKKYSFSNNPPGEPPAPTVTIVDGYKLRAELTEIELNATSIEFQVYKDDKKFTSGTATIKGKDAAFTCDVDAGGSYKARCRAVRDEETSDWGPFSSEYLSAPAAPASIKKLTAVSATEVYIDWENVSKADYYVVQYTTKKKYFDSSEGKVTTLPDIKASEAGHAEVPDLATGQEYFFRVAAKRGDQLSEWSEIKSIVIGKKPSPPTTWSSKTKVKTGEPVTLYWVHNAEDGSKQTEAFIETTIDGVTEGEFYYSEINEDEVEPTYSKTIYTDSHVVGTKILWRVKTKGVTNEYSEYSVQRTVEVCAPTTLALDVTDSTGASVDVVTSFPIYVSASAGPATQKPIGYHVSVISNETYDTVDHLGNKRIVNENEVIYSRYFDISSDLLFKLSADNIDLENNQSYTIKCVVHMDVGFTTEAKETFIVYWKEQSYYPTASIGFEREPCIAHINPVCRDANEQLIDNVLLSVYRREFDGSFTEIATGIRNTGYDTITDLHPSLDVARYRIVATDKNTGAVSYLDVSEFLGEKAVIIQWNEQWTIFEAKYEDALEEPTWGGSLLRLPYNIDISDSHKPDVALVEYIGREQPVSYYGTQQGSTSTWNVVIPKNDAETLYALRRLAKWMGDVYVREPSGSGYWANVTVSFSQKHRELTIPVTLNITRVAGGA